MRRVRLSFSYFHKHFANSYTFKSYTVHTSCLPGTFNKPPDVDDNEKVDIIQKFLYSDVVSVNRKKKPVKPAYTGSIVVNSLKEKKNSEPDKSNEYPEKEIVHFPYDASSSYLENPKTDTSPSEISGESFNDLTPSDNIRDRGSQTDFSKANLKFEEPERWNANDNDNVAYNLIQGEIKIGTSDPKVPVSSVPCGGCGALLHCNEPSIPGFLPQEVFKNKNVKELRAEICQRCHFLKEYDLALGVSVSPSEYLNIIGAIKDKRALALVLVDLTDFPCSINPDIFNLLGTKSFFVVGNKVDLFVKDGSWMLSHLEKSLWASLFERGVNMKNILHIALISAKTGFGIEELINKLHKLWSNKGDVYLIGCTNAGKSTLFNALINSDYCKSQARDIMQRATISAWPGTTLNLLKFPITPPRGWMLFARAQRLINEKKSRKEIAYQKLLRSLNHRLEQIPLSAIVNTTDFTKADKSSTEDEFENYASVRENKLLSLDPNEQPFRDNKWCFDTPGVVLKDQIINLLTTPELLLTVPKQMLIPRIFHLKKGTSLFIGGLARLDYVKGPEFAWFTVYASRELPVTITRTSDASYVYEKCLGSEYFRVPFGKPIRLQKWPEMKSKLLNIQSKRAEEAAGDVVLSNAGWVSVTMPSAYQCTIEAWTPEGRGIYVREVSAIKQGHVLKGTRIKGTPAFKTGIKEIKPSILYNIIKLTSLQK